MARPDGWIPAHRDRFDPQDDLWEGETICRPMAWLDLVQMAATQPHVRRWRNTQVELARGELLASYRMLAGRWNWSVKKVRLFLDQLQGEGTPKGTAKGTRLGKARDTLAGTVYCIVGYDDEVFLGHSKGHSKGHTQGHSKGQEKSHKEKKLSISSISEEGDSVVENSPLEELGVSREAIEDLRSLPGASDLALKGIAGTYGPDGTQVQIWSGIPEDRRADLLTTAVVRMASDAERWHAGFFRALLARVIEEELSPSPKEQAKAKAAPTPAGRMTAQEEAGREADRRAAARARATQRMLDGLDGESEEELQEAKVREGRWFQRQSQKVKDEVKAEVKARLEAMGPASRVMGMADHTKRAVIQERIRKDSVVAVNS